MESKLNVERAILLFAFRYSLGRMSYAPYSVTEAIKGNIEKISDSDIKQYIKEIYEQEVYGMDFDKEHWLKFAQYLEEELSNRTK